MNTTANQPTYQPIYHWQLNQQPSDRSLLVITLCVLLAHGIALFFAAIPSEPIPLNKPMERLVVKTIALGENRPSPPKRAEQAIAKEPPPPVVQSAPEPEPIVAAPEPVEEPPIELKPLVVEPEPEPVKPEKASEPKTAKESPPKPVAQSVKKVDKKPVKKEPAPKTTAAKETKAVPKKTEKAPPKKAVAQADKTPKKAEVKKQAAPKPDPQAEAVKAKQRALLAKAQESISRISKDKIASNTNSSSTFAEKIPGPIKSLEIEALPTGELKELSDKEIGYRDELAGRLKLLLRLPEFGEVKIKLTLDRSGKVVKVSVISAESAPNRKYIEKTIPTLSFPPFGSNFGSLPEYTFLVALSNDF